MSKIRNIFASFIAMLVLTLSFTAMPSEASAYDCIVTGYVYDNQTPPLPVVGATVWVTYRLSNNAVAFNQVTTNGNGFYEYVVDDNLSLWNDSVRVSAGMTGYDIVTDENPPALSYSRACNSSAVYVLDFIAIPN